MIPAAGATVRELQQRIAEMQPLRLDDRALPTPPPLRGLLPGGALRQGASYAVQGSALLACALLSEISASGAWCGVIGFPEFGAEAAAALGIALDRCVLLPHPGRHATHLAGTLGESLTAVMLRTGEPGRPGEVERVSARLREHGSALVVLGDWPRTESTLIVDSCRWFGLGAGHGALQGCEMLVRSRDRRGERRHSVRFENGRPA